MHDAGSEEAAPAPGPGAAGPPEPVRPAPAPPPMPVIVGVPRSGTTMLRLMLDAHSQLAIPSETYFLVTVARSGRAGKLQTPEQLFSTVASIAVWNDFGLARDAFRERLRRLDPFSPSDGVRAFYALYAERFGKPRWGDKTPRYTAFLPEIAELLPEVRFIHVIRDGRDVAVSLRETWFAPTQDAAGLAQYWKTRLDQARQAGARCPHYLEIRYEDLVRSTCDVLERVCAFIDLSMEPGMEAYHLTAEQRLSDLTPHYDRDGNIRVSRARRLQNYRLTTRPPEESRIGRWRQDMPPEDQLAFERVAGDLLRQLGYHTRT